MAANSDHAPESGQASTTITSVATPISTFAKTIMPMVLEMLFQGKTHTEAAPSHQALRSAALDPAELSSAIEEVMPEALGIVLEGLEAAIGPEFAPIEQDIQYLKDHISVWYRSQVLLQQMAANAN